MQLDAHIPLIPLYCFYLGFISAGIFFVNDLNTIEASLLGILDGLGLLACFMILKSKSLKTEETKKE